MVSLNSAAQLESAPMMNAARLPSGRTRQILRRCALTSTQVLPPSTVVARVAPPEEHEPAPTRQARWLSTATSMVCNGALKAVTDVVDKGLTGALVEAMECKAQLTELVSIPRVWVDRSAVPTRTTSSAASPSNPMMATREETCHTPMSADQRADDGRYGPDNLLGHEGVGVEEDVMAEVGGAAGQPVVGVADVDMNQGCSCGLAGNSCFDQLGQGRRQLGTVALGGLGSGGSDGDESPRSGDGGAHGTGCVVGHG